MPSIHGQRWPCACGLWFSTVDNLWGHLLNYPAAKHYMIPGD